MIGVCQNNYVVKNYAMVFVFVKCFVTSVCRLDEQFGLCSFSLVRSFFTAQSVRNLRSSILLPVILLLSLLSVQLK